MRSLSKTEKGYLYQARCLLKRFELAGPEDVTQEHVDRFRENAELSPVSIEAAIKAISILINRKFSGKKLKRKRSRPKRSVPLEDISKVYAVAKSRGNVWFCRFLKFAYITGLRHEDLIQLHRSDIKADVIEVEANKTGKWHLIPRHPILCCRLPEAEYPLKKSQHTVRKKFAYYCKAAGVPYFTPQKLRITAANEYDESHPGAGGVLQGSSLGLVLYESYLDQYRVLKSAQKNLRIPEAMLPKSERWKRKADEKEWLNVFVGMDDENRKAALKFVANMRKNA